MSCVRSKGRSAEAARTYYTLLTRDPKHPIANGWFPEFGDYNKSVVKAELDDYRDRDWKANELRITGTAPDQDMINAAVAALNQADRPLDVSS